APARRAPARARRIVRDLADDDLWLPHHVEAMARLLGEADFAHALPIAIAIDGAAQVLGGHLAVPGLRAHVAPPAPAPAPPAAGRLAPVGDQAGIRPRSAVSGGRRSSRGERIGAAVGQHSP